MWLMQNRAKLNEIIDDLYYWILRDDDTHIDVDDNIQLRSLWANRLQVPSWWAWLGTYDEFVAQEVKLRDEFGGFITRDISRRRTQDIDEGFTQGLMQVDDIIGEWVYNDIRHALDTGRNRIALLSIDPAVAYRREYRNNNGAGWVLVLEGQNQDRSLAVSYVKTEDSGNIIETLIITNAAFRFEATQREQNLVSDGGKVYLCVAHTNFLNPITSDYDFGAMPFPLSDPNTHSHIVEMTNKGDGIYEYTTDFVIGDLTLPSGSVDKAYYEVQNETFFWGVILRSSRNEE